MQQSFTGNHFSAGKCRARITPGQLPKRCTTHAGKRPLYDVNRERPVAQSQRLNQLDGSRGNMGADINRDSAMLKITTAIKIDLAEISFKYIRSPGPGGQNVNKVATAALLRFNVKNSTSLPPGMKARALAGLASRLTQDGDLILKASNFRTQERNREAALERLAKMLHRYATKPKARKKTKPSKGAIQKRLDKKKLRGKKKELRGRVNDM